MPRGGPVLPRQIHRRIWQAHDRVHEQNVMARVDCTMEEHRAGMVACWLLAGPTEPPGALAGKCIVIAHLDNARKR